MIDSARQHRTGSAVAALAPLCSSACPHARGGGRPPRLAAALLALSLLQACTMPAPKKDSPGQHTAVFALFCSKPDQRAAFRPGRQIPLSTESPLSLWLYFVTEDAPRADLAKVQVDLSVVDLHGQPTAGAVVQPHHLASNSKGPSPPITFLAMTPGDYRIRASFNAGASSTDSPHIVVKSGAAR